jgi:hypothetical protein
MAPDPGQFCRMDASQKDLKPNAFGYLVLSCKPLLLLFEQVVVKSIFFSPPFGKCIIFDPMPVLYFLPLFLFAV